ncbi:MAG: 8-oxoguanine DNA glycosylase [Firmicutes bacterium]|nr:8-oxoguanine DNA glycosylase [Bacillota bacterium]
MTNRSEIAAEQFEGGVLVKNVKDFNADHIFDCGQCFRWERNEDGSYDGMAGGRAVTIGYDGETETLRIDGADEADFRDFWFHYLDLGRDYGAIKAELVSKDEVIASAIERGYGIRLLNQDKWETLLSFIISQNNNIPRIKGCIESLSRTLGRYECTYKGRDWYSLPAPEVLAEATEEDLAPCRLGYRGSYLLKAGKRVAEEGMESLERLGDERLTSDQVMEALRSYAGVGPKVASCIALFGMGRIDSFPVDVWMKRVMNRLYGFEEKDVQGMLQFAADQFGAYGGLAQQYLFYYITHFAEETK